MKEQLATLRKYRASNFSLIRGELIQPSFIIEDIRGMFAELITWILISIPVSSLLGWLITQNMNSTFTILGWSVTVTCIAYICWPIVIWFIECIKKLKLPSPYFLEQFPFSRKALCLLFISYEILSSIDPYYLKLQIIVTHFFQNTFVTSSTVHNPFQSLQHDLSLVVNFLSLHYHYTDILMLILTACILGKCVSKVEFKRRCRVLTANKKTSDMTTTSSFRLWLGNSTGILADLWHGASMAPQQKITLSLTDAAQNIVILGGIGSGKTTCAIHPLLVQLLDQECGGLIFDIKGDFQQAVMALANHTNRSITLLGPNYQPINLLHGLTPEVAASFLKSIFLLSQQRGDAFWIDTATELCRNTLGLLFFLPKRYSLHDLYRYLFDVDARLEIDQSLVNLSSTLEGSASKLLQNYWHYHESIFNLFDEKVKAGVFATVAQVLSPFNHPLLIEAFCSYQESQVPMEATIDGAVYLVNLPLSTWGLGGKVAYSLIKLRFYHVMQQRTSKPSWNQTRPVFFLCDEFQEIVSANRDGLSDLNFWDKSRSSKTIGIISAQALSSFYAAIGDRHIADALLQNFRQKICFKTEDTDTLRYFSYLTDKVETPRVSQSYTSGKQDNPNSLFSTHSASQTTTTNWVDKPVLSPQLFRNLLPQQAIALLSIEGASWDDVIITTPWYL